MCIRDRLKVIDTLWALILSYPTFMIPFCTWLLMGYFSSIPREIEEAAVVDGATKLQVLWKVVLPTALPGLIAATVFSFLQSWNHLIYALAFVSKSESKILSAGVISELIAMDQYVWGSLMGAGFLACIPVIVIFGLLLDYYIAGLTKGAIK